ncbi:NAD-dependent succinate-semialdehyde dehydrogenase [Roseovarius pelagicus]|uniref:NAD-dependent succinate-semialdehyde dehydrogenase n=1 Tax=Roseovarius pelagicus TaxID=2980108 RepID=A0ABY6D7C0_9RHOB|nr:NAD-dependent succinate-semialdehyde dehydrogenase [Roseovarius pelagicus]UXX81510.1 NAD-dependent succinate-semialdehyde dehydrogenase [Roseovarius pelagicus]
MSYPDVELFIAGEWRPAKSLAKLEVLNPATGTALGTVSRAGKEDLDAALKAAESIFDEWKHTSPMLRCQIMRRAAELLRARADTIAEQMSLEQGKPFAQAKGETSAGADIIDWFAEEGRRAYGRVIPAREPDVTQLTIKEAIGPVAAFTPWNFPINQVVRKLSAALASGCSIIVKGPEETPASPAALVGCFADAGVPAGVVNLVYGDPAEISSYLIPHPVIRKVSFTGSTPVGKLLAGLAGQHMKPATMELGGHAPVLVFDDADVDDAVSVLAASKFRNAGQVCVSPTRFMIQSSVSEQFIDKFVRKAESIKVGPASDAASEMGPLANERRIPALEHMIADAVGQGATLRTGGKRIGNEGWFFEPTVLTDVPVQTEIMNEEPFGPIVAINTFSNDDEAIAEANRLSFGLAAYAWTRSSSRSQRLQHEIQSGMISINHIGLSLPEVPFGGIGDSGIGTEGGADALEAYLQTRFVTRKG